MCGICGIIKFNNHQVNENDLRKMMQTMKYRGPDDEGVWINSSFGLGFVRLSIIDLSPAGNQPMLSKDGRYVIVFNGEIYNYIELTQELISKGYVFITRSDTEVLLSAYSEWGEDCLNHLNGMFAFAIYDKKNKSIFAARDRFGVKPFYYYKDDEQFIFASEIPPILSVLKQNPRPNNQAIFDYLVFNRTDQTEDTFFEGIKKLQHGCQLSIVNHQLSIRKWYNLHANLKDHFYSPEEYRALFTSSINMRLRSDVPVGVCLSGGLDSSSIVSTMLQQNDITDFNTYSAIYGKGKPGDESKYIQEYADKIKLMHYAKPEASSLLNDMDKYIMAHAEPIPSTSSYAQFKVMELAKQNVKVILSGQGADEELAGYHYFFGYYFKELLYKGNIFKLIDESFHYLSNHHSLFGFKTFLYFILSDKVKKNFHASKNIALNPDFILQYQDTF